MRLIAALILVFLPLAGAQQPGAVEVIRVSGPLDQRAVQFLDSAIREAGVTDAQVAILQIDSPAALTDDIVNLRELIASPPLPVVVWIGPAPGVAYGGVAQLLPAASLATAAPGTQIGYLLPTVAGGEAPDDLPAEVMALSERTVEVSGPITGLVDEVIPSIGQVVVGLDGRELPFAGGTRVLETAEEDTTTQPPTLRPSVDVRFSEPGLLTTVLRLAVRPEAAFFFLAAGLTVIAFEFFALGPGIAAGIGAVGVILGGYGVASLPVNWWALLLLGLGLVLLAAAHQRGGLPWLTALGAATLFASGLWFTRAGPQLEPTVWGVVLTTVFVVAFFTVGMRVVGRARFSTSVVERTGLIGRSGVAATDLTPDGLVEVGPARWKARSHREAGIRAGDAVVIAAVDGVVLDVEPQRPSADLE